MEINNDIIIYNFTDTKFEYFKKCKPYLQNMLEHGLLRSLLDVQLTKDIEEFKNYWKLTNDQFNDYDLKLLNGTIPLLDHFITNGIIAKMFSNEDIIHLTKIIAKRYILSSEKEIGEKVLCHINVFDEMNNKKYAILVNCYNSINRYGKVYKPVKGSVINTFSLLENIIREIYEELNFTVDSSRIQKIAVSYDMYGNFVTEYNITFNYNDFLEHIVSMDNSKIDTEITTIIMRDITTS